MGESGSTVTWMKNEDIKEKIAGILCDKSKYDKSSCILYDLSGIKMILNL